MTLEQFSNEFDVLLNTASVIKPYGFTQGIELDEYEKSVFLSHAQEELVRKTYRGQNFLRESFEETELIRRYLDKLIKQQSITSIVTVPNGERINQNSVFFALPEDLMVITYEALIVNLQAPCSGTKEFSIIPIRQDEYSMQKDNPFRQPTVKGRTNGAWRLDYGNTEQRAVEIIPPKGSTVNTYILRYIRKPKPIILVDLTLNNLDIDGETSPNNSELDEIFHRQILELAVIKALQSKSLVQREQTE